MCVEELPEPIRRQGFKGVQTMPRQLTFEPLTKTLRAYPVKEISSLRGNKVRGGPGALVTAAWQRPVRQGGAPSTHAQYTSQGAACVSAHTAGCHLLLP